MSIAPATGETIGHTPLDSPAGVKSAVRRAREAQHDWAERTFRERARHLFLIRDFIVNRADDLASVISRDNGKTRIDALSTEILPAALTATYYARHARQLLRRHTIRAGSILLVNKRSYVERVPFGVIGIISPWNYPFSIPFHEIIMALISGNGVIVKTATQTQEVAKALAECLNAGNLPDGLCTFLNLPGQAAGDAFLDAGIDKLFFTGSVAVGRELMAKAGKRLVPVSLELGGNDAMIVCRDANLYRAAAGAAWAGYSNCGQSCGGVERIYVEKPVYAQFMEFLRSETRALRYGHDTAFNVEIGAMTTEQQLNTVKRHMQDALGKGAVVTAEALSFDGPSTGWFFPPTILENVTDDMLTMREETFGPILAVMPVDSVEEAIARANDSFLGLTASVWSRDRQRAHRIAALLEAGTVTINDHLMSHGMAETPWGGFKSSGIGRTHGYLGLEEMTQPRCVVDDILPGVQRNMWWYPHGRRVYRGLLGALHALYSRNLLLRTRGLIAMTGLFVRTFRRERR